MKLEAVLQKFPDLSVREALVELGKVDPYIWTMAHRRLRGRPLVYDIAGEIEAHGGEEKAPKSMLLRHRPFLIQPLTDQHPHKCYKKGRQVGISELSITEVEWFLDAHDNTKWIYCVPEEAEILTRRGWKNWYDLLPTDETLGLDMQNMVSVWESIKSVHTFRYAGDLNVVGPFYCTEDHRWPVYKRYQRRGTYELEIVPTHKLSQRHTLLRLAPHVWGDHPSILSPRLAAILGWVVTDGCQWLTGSKKTKNTVMMTVSQSERKYLAELEALLRNRRRNPRKQDNGNTCWTITVRREDVDAILAIGYRNKSDLPSIVTQLSQSAAKSMWEAMIKAEGCTSGPKLSSIHFSQNRGPVLDAFQILCSLLGCAANITRRGAYVISAESRSARMRALYNSAHKIQYRGTVWCPHTASGTWFMRYHGKVVFTGNTFPRDAQLKDFSVTRINESLDETEAMRHLVGVPNQVYTKRIGNSYLILRSAWESNLGEGIDADGVSLDEKDRMKDGVDIAFRESLASSRFGYLREISTPTLPGKGVDETFQKSCQYVWMVKCTKCGKWQRVSYPDNVVQLKDVPIGTTQLEPGTYEYACERSNCRGRLDRINGRWIATFPSRSHIAGYHMPQTIAPWITATEIMQKKIEYRFAQLWFNYCLAECSMGERLLLTDQDFFKCIAGHSWFSHRTNQWSRISVGIDWGQHNWAIVIGVNAFNNLPYIIGFGVFEDDDRDPLGSARKMVQFLEPFEPDIIIADAGYGKDRNAYLLKHWEDRFYACYYNPSDKHSRTFKPQFVPQSSRVLADRTIALKTACQIFRDKQIGLPVFDANVQLIMKHFLNLAPLQIEEDGEIYETIDHTGPDHLAHCVGYAYIGYEYITAGWNTFSCSWE